MMSVDSGRSKKGQDKEYPDHVPEISPEAGQSSLQLRHAFFKMTGHDPPSLPQQARGDLQGVAVNDSGGYANQLLSGAHASVGKYGAANHGSRSVPQLGAHGLAPEAPVGVADELRTGPRKQPVLQCWCLRSRRQAGGGGRVSYAHVRSGCGGQASAAPAAPAVAPPAAVSAAPATPAVAPLAAVSAAPTTMPAASAAQTDNLTAPSDSSDSSDDEDD